MNVSMKLISGVSLALFLTACGSQAPDRKSVTPGASATSASASANVEKSQSNTVATSAPVDVSAMTAEIAQLENKKVALQAQQGQVEAKKVNAVQPNAMGAGAADAFKGNLGAGADLGAAGVDQAKVDDLIQAIMDADPAAIKDAIEDLIADIQAAIADVQAQIDDLKAAIAAAK